MSKIRQQMIDILEEMKEIQIERIDKTISALKEKNLIEIEKELKSLVNDTQGNDKVNELSEKFKKLSIMLIVEEIDKELNIDYENDCGGNA